MKISESGMSLIKEFDDFFLGGGEVQLPEWKTKAPLTSNRDTQHCNT